MQVRPGRRGVLLPGPKIALDTAEPGYSSVCSHAHSDHVPYGARRAHATPATADVLAHRASEIRVERHDYGASFDLNGARITFLPSGHILGAAFTRVEWHGETLLYTADFKLREPATCAPAARGDAVRAELLVMESTFGLPVYQFPETRVAAKRAVAFATEVLDEGGVPVFLAYNLGKAHEVARLLGEAGVPTALHGAAWTYVDTYRRHGVGLPLAEPYERDRVEGRALIAPPSARASPMVENLKNPAIAWCSGWAALESQRAQLDADLLLPLSDHCDFPDLLRFLGEVGPKKVYTNHGYSDILAHILRKRGVAAEALHAGVFDEEESEGVEAPAVPADA